jgi:hypothetical protein
MPIEKQMALNAQIEALKGQKVSDAAKADADAAKATRDEDWRKILANTEGRADELRNDPAQRRVLDFLSGVTQGDTLPYDQGTLNALEAQNARSTAAQAGSMAEQLRASAALSGGNPSDPSYQAAMREIDSKRMGANLDYAGQMRPQAALQNFQARMQGANQLGAANAAQNSQINALLGQGAAYRSQHTTDIPEAQGQTSYGPVSMSISGPIGGMRQQQPQQQLPPVQYAWQKPNTAPPPPRTGNSPSMVQYTEQQLQQQGYVPKGVNTLYNGVPVQNKPAPQPTNKPSAQPGSQNMALGRQTGPRRVME